MTLFNNNVYEWLIGSIFFIDNMPVVSHCDHRLTALWVFLMDVILIFILLFILSVEFMDWSVCMLMPVCALKFKAFKLF